MSLDTYAHLQTAIASHLDRTDLTTPIVDFITMAEAELNRRLLVRAMTTYTTLSISSEFTAVPSGFSGVKSLSLTSTDPDASLEYVTPQRLDEIRGSTYSTSAQPKFYTVEGSNIQVVPIPDGTYTARLTYWTSIPALSDSNTTNWLLTAHPDVYLYGACVHAGPYLVNDPRLPTWKALFESAIKQIMQNDADENFGGRIAQRGRVFG